MNQMPVESYNDDKLALTFVRFHASNLSQLMKLQCLKVWVTCLIASVLGLGVKERKVSEHAVSHLAELIALGGVALLDLLLVNLARRSAQLVQLDLQLCETCLTKLIRNLIPQQNYQITIRLPPFERIKHTRAPHTKCLPVYARPHTICG